MYNFEKDEWTELSPMARVRNFHGCGLVKRSDGTLEAVVAGGDEGLGDDTVEIYNFDTQTWR